MAFASLDDPTEITVEGRVAATQAWSTSKVLIVAAFLDTVADGEPDKISDRNRKLIKLGADRLRRGCGERDP